MKFGLLRHRLPNRSTHNSQSNSPSTHKRPEAMSFPIRRARWESNPNVLSNIGTPGMVGIISGVSGFQSSNQNRSGAANGRFTESHRDREIDSSFPIRGARWDISPGFPIMIGPAAETSFFSSRNRSPGHPYLDRESDPKVLSRALCAPARARRIGLPTQMSDRLDKWETARIRTTPE